MKKNRLFLFAALFTAAIGVFWLLFMRQEQAPKQETKQQAITPQPEKKQSAAASASGNIPPKPRLVKMKGYPPTTPEHKAMWDWWRAMEKADPKFQWKMPIECYGVVVDQFGAPVADATVHFTWTAIDDSHEMEKLSGAEGHFEFTGQYGKALDVSVRKVGFLPTRDSRHSFEYAAFFDDFFHVPDRSSPVVFRLQKLMGAEPTYAFPAETASKPNDPAVYLNISNGKFGQTGDIAFNVTLGSERTQFGPEYTIIVTTLNGAGLLSTTEEFPFLAPEQGYQSSFTLHQPASQERIEGTKNLKFYIKLAGERYAFLGMEVAVSSQGTEVRYNGGVRHNEKWSRNLEFDHRKWLNP